MLLLKKVDRMILSLINKIFEDSIKLSIFFYYISQKVKIKY